MQPALERGQVRALVSQRGRIGRGVLPDEAAGVLEVVGAAHRQRCRHPAAVEVEGGEVAVVERPPHDRLARAGSHVLHPGPVRQVGEEVGNHVVLHPATEHVERDRLPLVEGVVPVLDAHRTPVDRAVVLAYVAGGEDPGCGGLEPTRTPDAAGLTQLETGLLRERRVRQDAGAHDHGVAGQLEPALRHDLADPPIRPLEAVQLLPAVHVDPVVLQHSLEVAAHLGSVGVLVGDVLQHHDRALHPVRPGERGRDLGSYVAAPDHHHPLGAAGLRADRLRVRKRPQVVDAVELAAVHPQPAHVCTGGEERRVELDLVLRRQRDHALARIELHHARAQHQVDVLLPPPLVRTEQHLVPRLLALEISLREGRPVVRRIGLAADQHNGAVRALLPQPARTVRRGKTAADQQVVDLPTGHDYAAAPERLVKRSVTRGSMPTSSTSRTSSPAWTTESPAGTKPPPSRRIEITSEPSGSPRFLTALPAASEPSATSSSMISSRSSGRSSRWTRPYFGTSCSIRRRIRSVAEMTGLTPSSSKCCRLRGLLQRATTRPTPYFSRATCEMRMLSSSSPVTATTRSARSTPARSSTHSSEPSPYMALCSSSCSTTPKRCASDSITVTSCRLLMSSRARFQPTFPAPTITTYMSSRRLPRSGSARAPPPRAVRSPSGSGRPSAGPARRTTERAPGRAPVPPRARRRSGASRSGRSRGWCCRRPSRRRRRRRARFQPRAGRRSRARCPR